MVFQRIFVYALLCLAAQGALAQMYKWVDENGNMHFSDRPQPSKKSHTTPPATTPDTNNATKERENNIQADIHAPASQPAGYPPTITLQMRTLLLERKFFVLNQRLADYHTAMVKDIAKERDLFTAYRAFRTKTPSFEPLLDAWVTATPDHYQPFLARALYYQGKAWAARGSKWASETEQQQFDEMNAYFKKASDDIAVVFDRNKEVLVSYSVLINMMRTSSDSKGILNALQAALSVNPNTYHVRRMAMYSLTPRWGGSFELMLSIATEAKQHAAQNPRLNQLEGEVYAEAANMKRLERKYNEAATLYNKSLEFGEEAEVLYDRGYNNYKRERYSESLIDIERAIALFPEDPSYYHRRARILAKLENYTLAVNDIKRAIEFEPEDKAYIEFKEWLVNKLKVIGYQQYKNRDPAASITTFNTALEATPDDDRLYYRRARSLIDQNKFDPAIADTRKAIELAPDEFDYYLLLDWLLAKRRDWDQIITYWDQYIARNPDNSRAYVERGGAYFHKGDMNSAVSDAKMAADMGNVEGKEAYEKFKHHVN